MKRSQPSFLQAMMLIMLSVGLISHVLIIPALLSAAKRDSWISVLLSAGPLIIFASMLAYVSRFLQHQTLHDWLSSHLGKPVGLILRVGNSLFFYAQSTSHYVTQPPGPKPTISPKRPSSQQRSHLWCYVDMQPTKACVHLPSRLD